MFFGRIRQISNYIFVIEDWCIFSMGEKRYKVKKAAKSPVVLNFNWELWFILKQNKQTQMFSNSSNWKRVVTMTRPVVMRIPIPRLWSISTSVHQIKLEHLGGMAGSRAGEGNIYKMMLEHPALSEARILWNVLRSCQKDLEANLKRLSLVKDGTVWAVIRIITAVGGNISTNLDPWFYKPILKTH